MEEEIKKQFEKQDKRFDDLMEFLVGNMATKDDLADLESRMATKDDLADLESRMATKDDLERFATKDDLANLRSDLMFEIRNIHDELVDIRRELEKLSKRTIEDADVSAKEILELKKRVDILERQIKEMQPA